MPTTTVANHTHLPWWTITEESALGRIRRALARQWEQTKADLLLPGGHDLNQSLRDTVHQVLGWHGVPPVPVKLHPDSVAHAVRVHRHLMEEQERARLIVHRAEFTIQQERENLGDNLQGNTAMKHIQQALDAIARATRQRDQVLTEWMSLDAAARYCAEVGAHGPGSANESK